MSSNNSQRAQLLKSVNHSLSYFAFAILALLVVFPTHAEDWELQPLKYNNPGLVVDLGVGLWAWPLPMEYDGDGDLD
ncbi:MAG: hypothetical protein HOB45_01025, partial [Planctomycetaceae bacterium]|nr:hypothetical protein [Planctomycetaceae bacterium]